jgi:predicted amidohydrolase
MADYNHLSEAEAIRTRTTYRSREITFSKFAISVQHQYYHRSMPFIENGHNVGFLQKRWYKRNVSQNSHYAKRSFSLGNHGWRRIQTFDTDCGKIGIVIYMMEFPELSRLMADEGMNILFVFPDR